MKQRMWLLPFTASLVCFAVLFGGFLIGVRDVISPPDVAPHLKTEPSEGTHPAGKPPVDGAFTFVALGDSLTRGVGDARGQGYVNKLEKRLKKVQDHVVVRNYGVSGARLPDLLQQIKQRQIRDSLRDAGLITVTIGGNDLFNGGKFLDDLNMAEVKKVQETAGRRLDTLFSELRALNDQAPILYVGLYNPFPDLEKGQAYAAVVHEWNYEASLTADKYRVTVVPTFDVIRDPANDLYSDHFHPNGESYDRIAERMMEVLPSEVRTGG